MPKPLLTLIQIKDTIDPHYFLQNFAKVHKKYTNGLFFTTNGYLSILKMFIFIKNLPNIEHKQINNRKLKFVLCYLLNTYQQTVSIKQEDF